VSVATTIDAAAGAGAVAVAAGGLLVVRGLAVWARGDARRAGRPSGGDGSDPVAGVLERTWVPVALAIPAAALAVVAAPPPGAMASPLLLAAIGLPVLAGAVAAAWQGMRRRRDSPGEGPADGWPAADPPPTAIGGRLAASAVLPLLAAVVLLLLARAGRLEAVAGQLMVAIAMTALWVLSIDPDPRLRARGAPPPPGTGGLLLAVGGGLLAAFGAVLVAPASVVATGGFAPASAVVAGPPAAIAVAAFAGLGAAALAVLPRVPGGVDAAERRHAPLRTAAIGGLAAAGAPAAAMVFVVALTGGTPGPVVAGGLGSLAHEGAVLLAAALLAALEPTDAREAAGGRGGDGRGGLRVG